MDRDQFLEERKAMIDKVGFTFIGVFDPEGEEPPFAYSIGLTERGWPEVVFVGGLRPDFIEILLTDLINGWFKAEKVVMGDNPDLIVFADGSSHALRVVPVPDEAAAGEYGCAVGSIYPDADIKFVQVLWPDKAGKFPDEEGYDTSMVQPIIGK